MKKFHADDMFTYVSVSVMDKLTKILLYAFYIYII